MSKPFTRLHDNKLYVVIYQDKWREIKTFWANPDGTKNANCDAFIQQCERRIARNGSGEVKVKELDI